MKGCGGIDEQGCAMNGDEYMAVESKGQMELSITYIRNSANWKGSPSQRSTNVMFCFFSNISLWVRRRVIRDG